MILAGMEFDMEFLVYGALSQPLIMYVYNIFAYIY